MFALVAMIDIPEKSKKLIDSLTKDEIIYEISLGRKSRFQRANFAYLQSRLAKIENEKIADLSRLKNVELMQNKESWKSKFENHPIIFGLTLVIGSFVAGMAFDEWTLKFRNPLFVESYNDNQVAEQIEKLTAEHNNRLQVLHSELDRDEKESVDDGHIDSIQQKYINASERVRTSIAEENNAYSRQLEQLMKFKSAKGN